MVIFICGCTYKKNMSEHIKMEPISLNGRDCFISVFVSITGCFSAIRIYSVYKTNVNNVPKQKFGRIVKRHKRCTTSVCASCIGTLFIRDFMHVS